MVLAGKPNAPTYVIAERKLSQQLTEQAGLQQPGSLPAGFRVFAVGDNPKSDVRGANAAGDHWSSILLRTGIWDGGENDLEDPADYVVQDVMAAVKLILQSASQEQS